MSVMVFTAERLGELARAATLCGVAKELRETCQWLAIASLANARAYEITYGEPAEAYGEEAIYQAATRCGDDCALEAYANLRYNCYSNGGQSSIKGGEVEQWLERIETAIRKWQEAAAKTRKGAAS